MPGMMLHIDGSKHRWLNDDRWFDLIVILDDATSEIYYAQLVGDRMGRYYSFYPVVRGRIRLAFPSNSIVFLSSGRPDSCTLSRAASK